MNQVVEEFEITKEKFISVLVQNIKEYKYEWIDQLIQAPLDDTLMTEEMLDVYRLLIKKRKEIVRNFINSGKVAAIKV